MKYVIAVLLLLLLLLLLTKIQVTFGYKNQAAFLRVKIGSVLLKAGKKEQESRPSAEKKQPDSEGLLRKITAWKRFFTESEQFFRKALKRAGKKLRIEHLEFFYTGGFENAAATALVYGAVSGLVYEVYALIQHFVGVEQSKIQMLPDFQRAEVTLETEWRVSLRIWHIGYIGVALLPSLFVKKRLGL